MAQRASSHVPLGATGTRRLGVWLQMLAALLLVLLLASASATSVKRVETTATERTPKTLDITVPMAVKGSLKTVRAAYPKTQQRPPYEGTFIAGAADLQLLASVFATQLEQPIDVLIVTFGAAIQNVEAQCPKHIKEEALSKKQRTLVINIDFPELVDYLSFSFWDFPDTVVRKDKLPQSDEHDDPRYQRSLVPGVNRFMFATPLFQDLSREYSGTALGDALSYMKDVKVLQEGDTVPAEACKFGDDNYLMLWYLNVLAPLQEAAHVKMVAAAVKQFIERNNVRKAAFINNIALTPVFPLFMALRAVGLDWIEYHHPVLQPEKKHVVMVTKQACPSSSSTTTTPTTTTAAAAAPPPPPVCLPLSTKAISAVDPNTVYDIKHVIELVGALVPVTGGPSGGPGGSLRLLGDIDHVSSDLITDVPAPTRPRSASVGRTGGVLTGVTGSKAMRARSADGAGGPGGAQRGLAPATKQ